MLRIKLEGLLSEPDSHKATKDKQGWAEWRALQLIDEQQKSSVAEWFYVVACNQIYFDEVLIGEDWARESRAIQIQSHYDEKLLQEFADEKIKRLEFNSWDDFYEKMPQEFVYEDSE